MSSSLVSDLNRVSLVDSPVVFEQDLVFIRSLPLEQLAALSQSHLVGEQVC